MAKQALRLAAALFALGVSAAQAQCFDPAAYTPDANWSFGEHPSSCSEIDDMSDFVPSEEACFNETGLPGLTTASLLGMLSAGCCSDGRSPCASYTMNPCADPAAFDSSASMPWGDDMMGCGYIPSMMAAFEQTAEGCNAMTHDRTYSAWAGIFAPYCCTDRLAACADYVFNPCSDKAAFDPAVQVGEFGASCGEIAPHVPYEVSTDANADTCFGPVPIPGMNATTVFVMGILSGCCKDGAHVCTPHAATISGSITLTVSDPATFAEDPTMKAKTEELIASKAKVPAECVVEVVLTAEGTRRLAAPLDSVSLTAQGVRRLAAPHDSDSSRRLAAGSVTVGYVIAVPADATGGMDAVAEAASTALGEQTVASLQEAFTEAAGSDYTVTVEAVSVPEVVKAAPSDSDVSGTASKQGLFAAVLGIAAALAARG